MAKQIFVNMPVRDLQASIRFFTSLGFYFNQEFTDDKGACMIIGENIYAMLLTTPFFKTFINNEVCDTKQQTEAILAIDAESRSEVDEMIDKALQAGGSEPMKAQDHGWMYGRSFKDLDGHHWEILYMDMLALEKIKEEGIKI